MIRWPRTRKALFIYSLLAALGGLFLSTRFLFAGSLARLALGALLLAFAGAFALLLNRVTRDPDFAGRFWERMTGTSARRARTFWLALPVLVAAGAAAAMPSYRVMFISGYYWEPLQPIFLWIALLAAGVLLLLWALPSEGGEQTGGSRLGPYIQPASLILALFFAVWLLMRLTALGLERREDYWYGAGVPALLLQVLAALALGWLAARVTRAQAGIQNGAQAMRSGAQAMRSGAHAMRSGAHAMRPYEKEDLPGNGGQALRSEAQAMRPYGEDDPSVNGAQALRPDEREGRPGNGAQALRPYEGRGMDTLFFLLSWAVTAFVWAREPMRDSFFMPGPFRPTGDFFPFSDGILFDVGGQFALIGQGLMNGQVFDRVLYMAFSAYQHALAGQNFVTVMAVQAALFASIAGILYLLGRELGGTGLGVALAALTAMRGVNSIAAATWIDLANPKMTLTDFPTAIGVALFTLMLVRWLKDPAARRSPAVLAGGSLGLTLMLRVHVLLLLVLAVGLGLLVTRFQWRRWLPGVLLLLAGMFAATLPWDLRNQSKGAPPFDMYFHSIRVVLQARYGWPPPAVTPTPETRSVGGMAVPAPDSIPGPCKDLSCKVSNHFLHNIVTAVLYLPASPVLDDLRTTVKSAVPFWSPKWRGEGVSPISAGMIVADLALIALGLALAWRRGGWMALAPLAVFLTYILSNALAQTSGGRYIVPVDWVIGLYFLWGALALLGARGTYEETVEGDMSAAPDQKRSLLRRFSDRGDVAWALLLILLVGATVPFSERLAAPRYSSLVDAPAVLASIGVQGGDALTADAIQTFLAQPGAGLWTGRMLYPRFYEINKGETAADFPYNYQLYPRMAFTLIGPQGQTGVVFPGPIRKEFGSGLDAVVLGCSIELPGGAVDALVVILPGGDVSIRAPLPDLECPLRTPLCMDNDTCQ